MTKQDHSLCRITGIVAGLLVCAISLLGCESRSARLAAAKEEVKSVGGSIFEYDDGTIHYDLRFADLEKLAWEEVIPLAELNSVGFLGPQFTDDYVSHLAGSDTLKSIALFHTNITDAGVARLRDIPNLKLLGLAGCQITDACVPDLLAIESLEQLDISATPITFLGAQKLAQRFSLEWSYVPSKEVRQALQQVVQDGVIIGISSEALTKGPEAPTEYHLHVDFHELVPKLENPDRLFENLSLIGSVGRIYLRLYPMELDYLKPETKIYSLSMFGQEEPEPLLDARPLTQLASLHVTDLSLSFANDLPPTAYEVLAKIEGLKELSVFNQTITPAHWKQLTSCPELKTLYLFECPFQDLSKFEATVRPLELRLHWMENVSDKDQATLKELTQTSQLFEDD